MGKSPKKKSQKLPMAGQIDLLSLYTRLGDLSKEELIFIKQ